MSTKIDIDKLLEDLANCDAYRADCRKRGLPDPPMRPMEIAARSYLSLLTGEPSEEMVERACAAFDKAADANGFECDSKQKQLFEKWMRSALSAALKGEAHHDHMAG